MVNAVHSKAVLHFASGDGNEPLCEGIVLEPTKGLVGAIDLVPGDRSATMLGWKGFDGFIEIRSNVIGYSITVLDLHGAVEAYRHMNGENLPFRISS